MACNIKVNTQLSTRKIRFTSREYNESFEKAANFAWYAMARVSEAITDADVLFKITTHYDGCSRGLCSDQQPKDLISHQINFLKKGSLDGEDAMVISGLMSMYAKLTDDAEYIGKLESLDIPGLPDVHMHTLDTGNGFRVTLMKSPFGKGWDFYLAGTYVAMDFMDEFKKKDSMITEHLLVPMVFSEEFAHMYREYTAICIPRKDSTENAKINARFKKNYGTYVTWVTAEINDRSK